MRKIKNYKTFEKSLNIFKSNINEGIVNDRKNNVNYFIYKCIDAGYGSELEDVFNFLLDSDIVFSGEKSTNRIIYEADLYCTYIIINMIKHEMIITDVDYSEKEDVYRYLLDCDYYPKNENVYFLESFNELKRVITKLNIVNYFSDKKNIYENLLNKLVGPTKDEAIKKLNDNFEDGKIDIEDYIEKLIENGFINELDNFLYEYDYDYESMIYFIEKAIYYKNYDVMKYLIDLLEIDINEIETIIKNNKHDDYVNRLLKAYLKKNDKN